MNRLKQLNDLIGWMCSHDDPRIFIPGRALFVLTFICGVVAVIAAIVAGIVVITLVLEHLGFWTFLLVWILVVCGLCWAAKIRRAEEQS